MFSPSTTAPHLLLLTPCHGINIYCLGPEGCVILPPGQCLILIWSLSEISILFALSCPLPHSPARLGLQSLCPVSIRKTHLIAMWGILILIKFQRIILWKKYDIHYWGMSMVLCFFRLIMVVSFLGAMDN